VKFSDSVEQYDLATLEDERIGIVEPGRLGEFDGNDVGRLAFGEVRFWPLTNEEANGLLQMRHFRIIEHFLPLISLAILDTV
jgi:hypothetical protein